MSELNFKQEYPTEKICLSLANRLINEAAKSLPDVKSVSDIDCNLIVQLYQDITGNIVPDLLVCKDKEDEVHNVQAAIDALSLDAIGISLSHITGEDIVAGNLNSVFNLLQILEGVWLYLPVKENGQRVLKRKISKMKKKSSITDFKNSSSESIDEIDFARTENFSSELGKTKSLESTFKENDSSNGQTYSPLKRKVAKLSHIRKKEKKTELEEKIESLYCENLNLKLKALVEKNCSLKSRSSQMKKTHLQRMKKPLKKSPISSCHKSFLLPHSLRRRLRASSKQTDSKDPSSVPYRIPAHSRTYKIDNLVPLNQAPRNFIEVLSTEFPGIHLPPKTWKKVKEEYEQHLLKMQNQVKTCLLQKSKVLVQAEETVKRQQMKSNIAKKEAQKQQYLNELKEQKNQENKMKYRLRDSRLEAAKMKQYYNEFHEEMRKKMQTQNVSKEMLFGQVFKEIVSIQKYHVNALCKKKKEAENEDAKNYLNYLTSLENLYQTQFLMLSEILTNEKKDMQIKINAEKQMIDKTHRDFQDALKQEIRFMQKTIVELANDQHFIEMDAEQFIEKIQKQQAKY